MIKLLVFCLFTLFLCVNSRSECSKFTCEREKSNNDDLIRVASVNLVPYLAGLRRVGAKEPFCFGVFVKNIHILTSRFCDADINTIEALHVPLSSGSYEKIATSKIVNKRVGTELLSYQISNKLSLQNGYFKSKFADVLWNEIIEMSKNNKKVLILGYGSYSFNPNEKAEMPNAANLMFATFDIKSVYSGSFILSDCCERSASFADAQAWKNKKIFVLESFRRFNSRCFAETGGPVISTQNGHIYGIVRGHYRCSTGNKAQIVVSALVDEEIVTPIATGNMQDLYPPTLVDDDSEDSGTGAGISDQDPAKRNQTLKELAHYGDDYYYSKSPIIAKSAIVYFGLIKLIYQS